MFLFNYLIQFNWEEKYSGISVENQLPSKEYKARPIFTFSGNAYVLDCLFNSFVSNENGGAIDATSAKNFMVESTSFIGVHSTAALGGAIYHNNVISSVISKVCSFDCSVTNDKVVSNGQVYFQYPNDYSIKDELLLSSFSNSVTPIGESWGVLMIQGGSIYYINNNSSNNYNYAFASGSMNPYGINANNPIYSYSAMTNDTSRCHSIFNFGWTNEFHEIFENCNILRNSCSKDYGLIIPGDGTLVKECCILNNDCYVVFSNFKPTETFFHMSVTLVNCTIDEKIFSTYSLTISFQSTPETQFINALTMINTAKCVATYDTEGTLTPNLPKIVHTLSVRRFMKKPRSVLLFIVLVFYITL